MIFVVAGLTASILVFGCSVAAHPDWTKGETSYAALRHPKDWKMTEVEEPRVPTFREAPPNTMHYVGPTSGWKGAVTAQAGGSDDAMYAFLSGLMSAGVSVAQFDVGGDLPDREILEEALAEDALKYVDGEQEMKNDKGPMYGDGAKISGATGKLDGAASFRFTQTWDPISKQRPEPDKQRECIVAAKDGKLIIVWFTPSGLLTEEQMAMGQDVMDTLSIR